MKTLSVSYFLAIILFGLLQSTLISAPQDVARKLFRQTVLLTMKDTEGRPLCLGSGFVLKPGYIVSNFHVVEGAGSGLVKPVDEKKPYKISGIVAKDEARDLVILAVEGMTIEGVTLSKRLSLDVGETVFAIGNPRGLEGTFSQGIVSSVRELESLTLLQITAPISPGSSGGPIADEHGEIVGVAVATFRGGQNLNFAIPAKYVSTLEDKIGAPAPLAKEGKGKETKTLLSGLESGKSTDGVTANSFLWDAMVAGTSSPRDGKFSISIKNNLDSPISDPVVLLLFYNDAEEVIESTVVGFSGTVPAGLAKRVKGEVEPSVKQLTTGLSSANRLFFSQTLKTRLDCRTIGFLLEEK